MFPVTGYIGYTELQKVTCEEFSVAEVYRLQHSYTGSQLHRVTSIVTCGYIGLQVVTYSYMWLHRVTSGYVQLHVVT